MSVEDVASELRRVRSLLVNAFAAVNRADDAITEGAVAFETATLGSTRPEVDLARNHASVASECVHAARAGIVAAQELVDSYHRTLTGDHGADFDSGPLSAVPVTRSQPLASEDRYTEWIDELVSAGVKISPRKVVRMVRQRLGRLVWLETGHHDHAGQAHILRQDRRVHFNKAGIPTEEIIDVVIACLERGRYVGRYKKVAVYDVDHRGKEHRIAVVIGDNGFIITSYPIGRNRRIS